MTNRDVFTFLREEGSNYRLTRFIILRALGFVYTIAFLVAINQIIPLIGHHGLTPADHFLNEVQAQLGSRSAGNSVLPSLFWLNCSDSALIVVSWIGLGISVVVLCGYANAIMMTLLWALYMSIVHVGQVWYGYGWETQLLETGFLGIFLCPILDPRPFSKRPPPVLVMWLYRWLGFRIMIGAGLIKLRGDPCWRDLTCLYYHYETQPIPNPLSRYLHFAPHWFHKGEVLWNHFVELIVPWFSFGPRTARHLAGILLVAFQLSLIISGNLSFLNYLTIIPFLACFDDTLLRRFFPAGIVRRCAGPVIWLSTGQLVAAGLVTLLVIYLSIDPVVNMASSRQLMNSSFNRFDLVNTYGAFGSVGRERDEIIFEGTTDETITGDTQWKEYEFKAKPGDLNRMPAIIAPYQPRIDWQIWFAAMSDPSEYPWTLHFVWRLLHNDQPTLSLLARNPFPDQPPHFIRARLFRYHFASPGESGWWRREYVHDWLPALSVDNEEFRQFLHAAEWDD